MQYRVFVGEPGAHREASALEFVAAFPNQETAAKYVRYLFGKSIARGKEIVIKRIDTYNVDPSEGALDGLITPLGEEIPLDELQE